MLTTEKNLFVPPIVGVVTSNFGGRRNHSGMDIDLEVWDTVVVAFDGSQGSMVVTVGLLW